MPIAEGRSFAFDGIDKIKKELLETIEFRSDSQLIQISNPEFSAVCPFSGLPDIATVTIQYIPTKGKILELKSLKYYFTSFRSVGVYQEQATRIICADLEAVLRCRVYVRTVYNTRGGINTMCEEGTPFKEVLNG